MLGRKLRITGKTKSFSSSANSFSVWKIRKTESKKGVINRSIKQKMNGKEDNSAASKNLREILLPISISKIY